MARADFLKARLASLGLYLARDALAIMAWIITWVVTRGIDGKVVGLVPRVKKETRKAKGVRCFPIHKKCRRLSQPSSLFCRQRFLLRVYGLIVDSKPWKLLQMAASSRPDQAPRIPIQGDPV
jgi:hypothetical protein